MHTKFARTVGRWSRAALVLGAVAALPGCTEKQMEGQSPAYLVITQLTGAAGATPTEFSGVLSSDVLTFVKKTVGEDEQLVPTVFADNGRVGFLLALKDPGVPGATTTPSSMNFITVTRYRVTFIRSDGRNTPGVDVPAPFDSAVTFSASPGNPGSAGFDLVRNAAKMEAPLIGLVSNQDLITVIATVTFYGQDHAGNDVAATGNIGITFGNFGDPE